MKLFIKRTIVVFLYYVFRIFPVNKNKIFVSNYHGRGYGDNAKYIVDELIREKVPCKIVWVMKNGHDRSSVPDCVRMVKKNTLRSIYEQVTAGIWIDNCRKQFYERKRKRQFYIQTWHGSFPLKKCEKSVEKNLDKEYVLGAKNDSKMADLFLSNSDYLTNIFREDFWYSGEILKCGCPRNDIVVVNNKTVKNKVYDYYNINHREQICLYAPTFRKDYSLDCYDIDFKDLKRGLGERFGGEWKIMLRLHPNISHKSEELMVNNKDIINVTTYDDMQELLVASDFMITDYSSCILDYALSGKPCCIYASDIEDYVKDRGFYMSFSEYPFETAENNKELASIIKGFDLQRNRVRWNTFFSRLGVIEDGKATRRVVRIIKKRLGNKKKGFKKEDKVLFRNTVMMYIMMVSSFVFPLITLPYLTRVLGAAGYGIVVLANAVMQYFQLFIDYGFILSGTAICSKERDNKEKLQRIVSSIIHGKLFLSFIGLLVVCVLAFTLEVFSGIEWFIVCSYIPLILTSFIPDYLFRGIERMSVITFRTIVAKLVYTVLIFILVRSADSYYFIPLSLFISNLLIVLWSWLFIRKELKMRMVRVRIGEVRKQLKHSSTFFASRIATTVYSASNIFVLGLYGFSDVDLGIYGAANTLINYGKSMFSPIADSLYPYMIKNKNHKLVRKIILILCPVILVGCAVLFLISDSVIALMAGNEYTDSVPIFRCMIPMLLITLPSYLYGFPMLGSIGRNDKANQSIFIGSSFHFIGLVLLVVSNTLTFYSIVILTTITETLILVSRVYYFNKYKNQLKHD